MPFASGSVPTAAVRPTCRSSDRPAIDSARPALPRIAPADRPEKSRPNTLPTPAWAWASSHAATGQAYSTISATALSPRSRPPANPRRPGVVASSVNGTAVSIGADTRWIRSLMSSLRSPTGSRSSAAPAVASIRVQLCAVSSAFQLRSMVASRRAPLDACRDARRAPRRRESSATVAPVRIAV